MLLALTVRIMEERRVDEEEMHWHTRNGPVIKTTSFVEWSVPLAYQESSEFRIEPNYLLKILLRTFQVDKSGQLCSPWGKSVTAMQFAFRTIALLLLVFTEDQLDLTHVRPLTQSQKGLFYPTHSVLPTRVQAKLIQLILAHTSLQLVDPTEVDGRTAELQSGLPSTH